MTNPKTVADKLRALAEFDDCPSKWLTHLHYRAAKTENARLKAALLAAADCVDALTKARSEMRSTVWRDEEVFNVMTKSLAKLDEVLK